MSEDWRQTAQACVDGSDRGTMRFPEVVSRLAAAGVERYVADLVRGDKTFYRPDGASAVVASEPLARVPAARFDAAGVDTAIRAVQAGTVTYGQFCAAIGDAGCVGYLVSLAGRRAVYFGRTGETHVEPFPGAA